MPILSRHAVDPSIRKPHEAVYRKKLRQSLLDPNLTEAQALDLRARLDSIGKPKSYDADSPPRPGAIAFPEPVAIPGSSDLALMKKADLVQLAEALSIPSAGTKAALRERIESARP